MPTPLNTTPRHEVLGLKKKKLILPSPVQDQSLKSLLPQGKKEHEVGVYLFSPWNEGNICVCAKKIPPLVKKSLKILFTGIAADVVNSKSP
jgi:hypothetical protein